MSCWYVYKKARFWFFCVVEQLKVIGIRETNVKLNLDLCSLFNNNYPHYNMHMHKDHE